MGIYGIFLIIGSAGFISSTVGAGFRLLRFRVKGPEELWLKPEDFNPRIKRAWVILEYRYTVVYFISLM